jgi:hypothetical protein
MNPTKNSDGAYFAYQRPVRPPLVPKQSNQTLPSVRTRRFHRRPIDTSGTGTSTDTQTAASVAGSADQPRGLIDEGKP